MHTALWQDHSRKDRDFNLLVWTTYSVLAYRLILSLELGRQFSAWATQLDIIGPNHVAEVYGLKLEETSNQKYVRPGPVSPCSNGFFHTLRPCYCLETLRIGLVPPRHIHPIDLIAVRLPSLGVIGNYWKDDLALALSKGLEYAMAYSVDTKLSPAPPKCPVSLHDGYGAVCPRTPLH